LFRRYFTVGVLENLTQNAPSHLLWLLDAVNVQERWRQVIHAGSQTHRRKSCLKPGPMAKNEPGTSSPSTKSCLAITGVGFLMVHVRVQIFLFDLAQGLYALVAENKFGDQRQTLPLRFRTMSTTFSV
jgi:hypothetical protein